MKSLGYIFMTEPLLVAIRFGICSSFVKRGVTKVGGDIAYTWSETHTSHTHAFSTFLHLAGINVAIENV